MPYIMVALKIVVRISNVIISGRPVNNPFFSAIHQVFALPNKYKGKEKKIRVSFVRGQEYIPGVMKGTQKEMLNGVMAGFPVVDVKAEPRALSVDSRREPVRKFAERKFPEFFRIFVPNFAPFLRSFRALLRGKRRPEKIHNKIPRMFQCKLPGKFEEKIHKNVLESRQRNREGKDQIPYYAP